MGQHPARPRPTDLVDACTSPTDAPGDDNGFAVYLAVQCTDAAWPTQWSKIGRDNWAVYAMAPFETWGNAWFNGPCTYWPASPHTPVQIDGSG